MEARKAIEKWEVWGEIILLTYANTYIYLHRISDVSKMILLVLICPIITSHPVHWLTSSNANIHRIFSVPYVHYAEDLNTKIPYMCIFFKYLWMCKKCNGLTIAQLITNIFKYYWIMFLSDRLRQMLGDFIIKYLVQNVVKMVMNRCSQVCKNMKSFSPHLLDLSYKEKINFLWIFHR